MSVQKLALMTANLEEARTHEPGWTLDHNSASGLPIGDRRIALGDSGAALRLAPLGGRLPRSLHHVLAATRQPVRGWHHGGSCVSAEPRRLAAQGMVPH